MTNYRQAAVRGLYDPQDCIVLRGGEWVFQPKFEKQRCRVVKASTDKNLLVCWNRSHVRGHAEVMAVSKGCFINSLLTSL